MGLTWLRLTNKGKGSGQILADEVPDISYALSIGRLEAALFSFIQVYVQSSRPTYFRKRGRRYVVFELHRTDVGKRTEVQRAVSFCGAQVFRYVVARTVLTSPGKSLPFGNNAAKRLNYLSSSQALADYAVLIKCVPS